MIHEANGAKFIAQDDMIVRWCRKKRQEFEPKTAAFIFGAMADGGVFIDVGASTGWYTVPLAMRGCEVHAIEPLPGSADRLEENLRLNGATATVHRAAASDHNGKATLRFNAGLPLTSGASFDECQHPTGEIEVRTMKVDNLGAMPALIKIDVEGHEIAVLKGAARTIRNHRPRLVLEANTARHRKAIEDWLIDYDVVPADERNLLCTPRS